MREVLVPPITLTTLGDLKARWGVSLQALIRRALALSASHRVSIGRCTPNSGCGAGGPMGRSRCRWSGLARSANWRNCCMASRLIIRRWRTRAGSPHAWSRIS